MKDLVFIEKELAWERFIREEAEEKVNAPLREEKAKLMYIINNPQLRFNRK